MQKKNGLEDDSKWCIGRKDETNNMFDKLHEEQEFLFVQNLKKLDDMFMINFTFYDSFKYGIMEIGIWDKENLYDEEGYSLDDYFDTMGLLDSIFVHYYKTKQFNILAGLLEKGFELPSEVFDKITKKEKEKIQDYGFEVDF